MSDTAGRSCPLRYRYSPKAIAAIPRIEAHTLYVVGGLYGNVHALDAIEKMAAAESMPVRICFNGDFNWFNVDDESFQAVMTRVLRHDAILGNVEAEFGTHGAEEGCGCAYPDSVGADVVERSNRIHARLKQTALAHPALIAPLEHLPMFTRYQLGDCRVGVVHGDAQSLAGWRFSRSELIEAANQPELVDMFLEAQVDVFASSHTCEPIVHRIEQAGRPMVVINNGAAGMPNETGERSGRVTRVSLTPLSAYGAAQTKVLSRVQVAGVEVAAVSLPYDHDAWRTQFLRHWPEGSDAYTSYYARIMGDLSGSST